MFSFLFFILTKMVQRSKVFFTLCTQSFTVRPTSTQGSFGMTRFHL